MPRLPEGTQVGTIGANRRFTDTDIRLHPELTRIAERYARDYTGSFDYVLLVQHSVRSGRSLTPGVVRAVLNCMRTDPSVDPTELSAVALGAEVIPMAEHREPTRPVHPAVRAEGGGIRQHWYREGDPGDCRKCHRPEDDHEAHLRRRQCDRTEPHGTHWDPWEWGVSCPGVEDPERDPGRSYYTSMPARLKVDRGMAANGRVVHWIDLTRGYYYHATGPEFVYYTNHRRSGFVGQPELRVRWLCGRDASDPVLDPAWFGGAPTCNRCATIRLLREGKTDGA